MAKKWRFFTPAVVIRHNLEAVQAHRLVHSIKSLAWGCHLIRRSKLESWQAHVDRLVHSVTHPIGCARVLEALLDVCVCEATRVDPQLRNARIDCITSCCLESTNADIWMALIIHRRSCVLVVVVQVDLAVDAVLPGGNDVDPLADGRVAEGALVDAPSLCSNPTKAFVL